jgi:cell division protein FtsB
LRKLNEDQRQEIMQTHTELVTLKRRNRHLQTAMSLLGDEAQREKARQQINYIISLVERVEQTLKQ